MRRPKLHYKRIYWFRCSDYQQWLYNPRVRGNHIKTRLIFATIYEGGFLSVADKLLFLIYDSFARLDKSHGGANIQTMFQCKLPKDYYFNLPNYRPQHDPMSKKYEKHYCTYKINKRNKTVKQQQQNKQLNTQELIKLALQTARQSNVKPPYFKKMNDADILAFINKCKS